MVFMGCAYLGISWAIYHALRDQETVAVLRDWATWIVVTLQAAWLSVAYISRRLKSRLRRGRDQFVKRGLGEDDDGS